MRTGNSQLDNHLLPFIKPYFVYQERMFHKLMTIMKIETCAKNIHRRFDSLLSSSPTKRYIKSKQPVGNPLHESVSSGYTYTLKLTGKIYHSSASLQFPAHTLFQVTFRFTRLTNLTCLLPNEKCMELNVIISFTKLTILKY